MISIVINKKSWCLKKNTSKYWHKSNRGFLDRNHQSLYSKSKSLSFLLLLQLYILFLEIEIPKIALLPPKQSNRKVESQGLILRLQSCAVVQFAVKPWDLISITTKAPMLCFMAKNASENRATEKNGDIHKFVFWPERIES